MAGGTVLKLGYTTPLTDTFGAHPLLGSVIDLNDGSTFTLASPNGLEIAAPPRSLLLAGNIRTQGEIATRAIVRHNRTVTARLIVGPSSSSAALLSAIRNLLVWLAAPPLLPITLQYQPFNASTPLYLDVVGASHNLPADEGQWLRGQFEPLTISFITRPGLRDARVTLQNLVANAGLEQPSTAGFVAFTDTFATTNLYATQAGSNPTAGTVNNNYPDVVMSDGPLRYYRLSEASGTTAYDVSGSGANGTYAGSPTLGSAGAISGDSNDKSVTFNGTSQYVGSISTAGLPTGNPSGLSLEAWIFVTGSPAGNSFIVAYGTNAAHQRLAIYMNSSRQVAADTQGTSTTLSSALSINTWHHIVGTWDGTTLRCYVDGAQTGTATPGNMTIPGSGNTCNVGADVTNAGWFPGRIDEPAIYASALSSARVTAHYNAGNAGTGMGTSANTLTIPASARIAFGSPAWSSLNTWQTRFRFTSGGTYRFYLHYTDASNYLRASITGTALTLEQVIAGVTNTLATTTISLASNVWYWLRLSQFPAAPNEVADVQAILLTDGNTAGSVGAQYALAGPVPTQDAVTALSGRPQLEASGAALILGGPYTSVHTVSLFGPGGWQLDPSSGTAVGSAAWEQNNANTYSGGPVSSYGAGRFDAPPTGAWDVLYHGYNGRTPAGTWAIPCAASQQLAGSLSIRSSGLAGSASLSLVLREYDASGAFLRSSTLAAVSGNQSTWTQLAGTATTGASCAYVDLALRALDATSASANGTLWLDNAQLWNKTQLSTMTSMPWCDLRAAVSPAMLVVSGLLGDLPAPCYLALGTYVASLPQGGALSLYVGRKAITSPKAQLVGVSYGAFSAAFSPQGFAQLDASSYGGFDSYASVGGGGWNPRAFSLLASDAAGVYHLLARVKTAQVVGNLPLLTLRVATTQQTDAWFNQVGGADIVSQWSGAYMTPFAAQNTWTIADAGQCTLPAFPQGALTDPTQLYLIPRAQWQDGSGSPQNGYTNWQALLPIDGSLLVATVNNPSNSFGAISNSWLWTYSDGLLLNRSGAQDGPSWTYSIETKAQPNPAVGAGGAGTSSSGAVNVNSGADPCLTIDPQQVGANNTVGVNQLVAIVSDQAGGVYPCFGEVSYSPLYLEPR